MTRLLIYLHGQDVSDETEIQNGKDHFLWRGNEYAYGWSQHELWHKGTFLGWIQAGYFELKEEARGKGYTSQKEKREE